MANLEPTGFSEFDRLLSLVRGTRELLDAVVEAGRLPAGGADFLAERTLPHLDDVQAGFQGWLRSDAAGLAELRHLLLQFGAMRVEDTSDVVEQRASLRGVDARDLVALAHARLVLAFLPRIPDELVRFPAGRRTYADIAVPRGPAELAERIVELERQLWRAAVGQSTPTLDPAFRRTYGFFDAAERLGWRAFGAA
jgi:hypothetical protein